MGEAGESGRFDRAKGFVVLVREGGVTLVVLWLIAVLVFAPGKLRSTLEQAGIQSVKLPLVEIQASLDESEEQLQSAQEQVELANATAEKAQAELAEATTQLDRVLHTPNLTPASRAQLQVLSRRLATSEQQVTASSARLSGVVGTLDRTAQRQRALNERLNVVRGR